MVHIVSISNYITFPSTQFTLYIKFALKDIFPWIMPSSVKRQKTDDWKFGMGDGDWRDQQRSGEVWPRRRPVLPSVFLLWLELLINWNVQVATARIAIRYVTDQFLGCWMTVTMLYNLRTISLFVPISLSVFFWGYKIDGWQIAVWEVYVLQRRERCSYLRPQLSHWRAALVRWKAVRTCPRMRWKLGLDLTNRK